MTVTLLASACPVPQYRANFLSISAATAAANAPVMDSLMTGDTLAVLQKWNRNATREALTASYGGGAYFVAGGLTLTIEATALTVSVSQGTAMIDGPVCLENAQALPVPASNSRVWIWLLQSGILAYTVNTTPPASPSCLLGSCVTSSTSVLSVDTSGVLLGLGTLVRFTADAQAPTDTPGAGLRFHTVTAGGVYFWDGGQYHSLGGAGSGGTGFSGFTGPYNAATAYTAGNVALSGGALYIALSANTNVPVSNSAVWEVFLPAGAQGEPGEPGAPGGPGPRGMSAYNLRGLWSSAAEYAIADAVFDSTGAYVAILASTGISLSDTAHWSQILPPGPAGPQGPNTFTFRGPYSATVNYAVNDVVQSSGAAYVAVAASGNINQLVTNTAYWYCLIPAAPAGAAGQGYDNMGAWSSTTAYQPYAVVTYGGAVYNALLPSTGAEPDTNPSDWQLWVAPGTGAVEATSSVFGLVKTDITESGGSTVYTKTTADSQFALASGLSSETTARANAVSAETTARTNADTAEAVARTAGDAASLQKAANLSDLASVSAARTNLGLGVGATAAPGFEIYIPGALAAGLDTFNFLIPSFYVSRPLTRLSAALDTAGSTATTFTAELDSASSGAFSASETSDTFTLASGSYLLAPVTSFTAGLTASGENRVKLNITAAGTGAKDLTVKFEF